MKTRSKSHQDFRNDMQPQDKSIKLLRLAKAPLTGCTEGGSDLGSPEIHQPSTIGPTSLMEVNSNDVETSELNPTLPPRPLAPTNSLVQEKEDTTPVPRHGSLAASSNNLKGLVHNIMRRRL
jgi:hypothetical protein